MVQQTIDVIEDVPFRKLPLLRAKRDRRGLGGGLPRGGSPRGTTPQPPPIPLRSIGGGVGFYFRPKFPQRPIRDVLTAVAAVFVVRVEGEALTRINCFVILQL